MKSGKTIIFKLIKSVLALIIVTFLITCTRATQQTLVESLLASCGDYQVFLSAWWNKVEDQQQEYDPMGGYIFLYWVDVDGNACHGDPGVSGQPGPVIFNGFHHEAYDAGNDRDFITLEQLENFQDIPFNLTDYTAGGFHFAQYANVIWRNREDGSAHMAKSALYFSIPDVVSKGYEFCLVPVFAYENSDCAFIDLGPSINEFLSSQHPEMCQERSLPVGILMSEVELLENCLLLLPQGLYITEPQ